MNNIMLLVFLYIPVVYLSQGWQPVGGRSNSMANAVVALSDVWSYHHNPGATAELKKMAAGISYENRFLLKELQSQAFVLAIPLKKGVASMGGQVFGFHAFRSYRTGLGYSLKLTNQLFAGVQLNYQGINLTGSYGAKNTITAEAGVLAYLSEDWKIGMSVYNLGRSKLADFMDDRFTTVLRIGTSYSFSKKVLVLLEAEKNIDYSLRIKAGLEYNIEDNFFLRGGFASNPSEGSFGLGYRLENIQLNVGSSYQQQLGWSPNFSLEFQAL